MSTKSSHPGTKPLAPFGFMPLPHVFAPAFFLIEMSCFPRNAVLLAPFVFYTDFLADESALF
jgi:hypothetical protein